MRLAPVVGSCVLAAACGQALAAEPARVEPARDVYYGEAVVDPYRWMETGGAAFNAWLKGQHAATRAALDSPAREALLKAIAASSAANDAAISPRLVGEWIFYLRRPPGAAMFKLFVRRLEGGPERVLVDPEVLSRSGEPIAIKAYSPSPDGRYVAYTLAEGGSEEATLHVVETGTGKVLSEAIDRTRFAQPEWDPRLPEFYYARLKAAPAGAPPSERFNDQVIYRHRLGEPETRDLAVFKVFEQGSVTGRSGIPTLFIPRGGAWALALVNDGVSATGEYYAAPLGGLRAGRAAWRKVGSDADQLLQVSATEAFFRPALTGSTLYLATLKDAARGRIVRLDLASPGAIEPVLAEQSGVLTNVAPARDGLYLSYALGGRYSLARLDVVTGRATPIAPPYEGAIYELAADPRSRGAVYTLESWARPRRMLLASGGASRDIGLNPSFPFDLSGVTADEIAITARDGVRVPVSVIRRAGAPDPIAPAILMAYGAYGISMDPIFDARWVPWVARGGVLVEVHARGGGEFGEAWHLAGQKATKPNTWRDLIDSAEAIAAQGYASPKKLVALGTSAGGIAVGRAVTERPDLFAGAIADVPIADMLRFETTEGGPANVPEYGTVATPEGYRALKVMSPYANIVDGTPYPALLVTGGINDHRVPIWQPAKLAARLQAASASGKPVLLAVDWNAGHGMGSSKGQRDQLYADFYAFALQATGDPEFASKPETAQSAALPR